MSGQNLYLITGMCFICHCQRSEEMEVVREAIESLRSCFRPHDPHHHTLDTLEQVVTSFKHLTHLIHVCVITPLEMCDTLQVHCCLGQTQDFRERNLRYGPLKAVSFRRVWGPPDPGKKLKLRS